MSLASLILKATAKWKKQRTAEFATPRRASPQGGPAPALSSVDAQGCGVRRDGGGVPEG